MDPPILPVQRSDSKTERRWSTDSFILDFDEKSIIQKDKNSNLEGFKVFFGSLLVTLVLIGPALLIWFVNDDHSDLLPNLSIDPISLNNDDVKKINSTTIHIMRYSVWLGICWLVFVASWVFWYSLPRVLILINEIIFAHAADEELRIRMKFLSDIRLPLSFLICAVASVLSSQFLFWEKIHVEDWRIAAHFAQSFLILSALFVIKFLFLRRVASSYNKVAYDTRLSQSKKAFYILKKLKKSIQRGGIKSIFTNMDFLDFHHFNGKKHEEMDDSDMGIFDTVIDSFHGEAESNNTLITDAFVTKTAKVLFDSLKRPENDFITQEDFKPYINEKILEQSFLLFDIDRNGSVDYDEFKVTIKTIFNEKSDLETSYTVVNDAVAVLNQILDACCLIGGGLLSALLFQAGAALVASFSAMFVGAAFVFSSTLKMLFENIVFMFVTHSYDIGDKININGQDYVVSDISIMTTGFLSAGKRVYIPNSILSTKEILNYRRGGDIGASTSIKVDLSIDPLKLVELERRMVEFVDSHPRNFIAQGCTLTADKLELNNAMTYNFWIPLKGSPQNWAKWIGNKDLFMNELKKACVELDIKTTQYLPINQ